jgi:hypothetical protein
MSKVIDGVVMRLYRANGYGTEAAPQTLSTVTEGNVTVQLKTAQYSGDMSLTDAEVSTLVPYRKLWY